MSELSTLESELVVATDSEDYEMVRTKLCTFHGDPFYLYSSCRGNALILFVCDNCREIVLYCAHTGLQFFYPSSFFILIV